MVGRACIVSILLVGLRVLAGDEGRRERRLGPRWAACSPRARSAGTSRTTRRRRSRTPWPTATCARAEPTPEQTLALVRDARPCARELDSALAARMRVHDEAGGAGRAGAHRRARGSTWTTRATPRATRDGAWRAVGARGLVRSDDRDASLRALVDPDPRVRRQAVRRRETTPTRTTWGSRGGRARRPRARWCAPRPCAPSRCSSRCPRASWPTCCATSGRTPTTACARTSRLPGRARACGTRAGARRSACSSASGHGPGVIEGAAAVLRTENTRRRRRHRGHRADGARHRSRARARAGCRRSPRRRSAARSCARRWRGGRGRRPRGPRRGARRGWRRRSNRTPSRSSRRWRARRSPVAVQRALRPRRAGRPAHPGVD